MTNTNYSDISTKFPDGIVQYGAKDAIVNRGAPLVPATPEARKLEDPTRLSPDTSQTTWNPEQFTSKQPTQLYPPDTRDLPLGEQVLLKLRILATAPDLHRTDASILNREYQTLLSYMKAEHIKLPPLCGVKGIPTKVKFAYCVNVFRHETGRLPPPSLQLRHLLDNNMLDVDAMEAWSAGMAAIAPEAPVFPAELEKPKKPRLNPDG